MFTMILIAFGVTLNKVWSFNIFSIFTLVFMEISMTTAAAYDKISRKREDYQENGNRAFWMEESWELI